MERKLEILFVLPSVATSPVGGFKIVYEYANRLSQRGHRVGVAHMTGLGAGNSLTDRALSWVKYLARKLGGRQRMVPWFPIHPSVDLRLMRPRQHVQTLRADVVIATAWQTAEFLSGDWSPHQTHFYLIQHLETWHSDEERVLATWHAPFRKIVIAPWLQEFGNSIGEQSYYIPNGLDFERFHLTSDIEHRAGPSAMMLYHSAKDKGSADGIAALSLVREQLPNLRGIAFGVPARPASLPEWMEYYQCPEQGLLRDLYNQTQVFVAPSWTEGWGLPASEAMCCGVALAATDVGGHRAFSMHAKTALLCPPQQATALADNILLLLRNADLRIRIANCGHARIRQFTWERSVSQMEEYLLKTVKEAS